MHPTHRTHRTHEVAPPEQANGRLPEPRRARWLALPAVAMFAACSAGDRPAEAPAAARASESPPQPGADMAGMPPPLAVAEPEIPAQPVAQAGEDMPGPAATAMVAQRPQWAPVRELPAPTYDPGYDGPRTDFRETIFWKPSLQTDSQGRAQVSFFLSDAVTSFRASAEGIGDGKAGRGDAVLATKLPVSLAAKLPLEVTSGDRIELPVVVTNATFRAIDASVSARLGAAFVAKETAPSRVRLEPQQTRTVYYDLSVIGNGQDPAAGSVAPSAAVDVVPGAAATALLAVPKDSIGALRLTLFDLERRPLAERVVYRGLGAELRVSVKADKSAYSPREKVTLTVQTSDASGKPVAGDVALAVVDDTVLKYADDKAGDILAELYLLPEMPGQTVREPNFYYSKDRRAPEAMDLLLGSQGYRRFAWKWISSPPR